MLAQGFRKCRVCEVQLAEGALIVRIPCEAGQLADGCPHDLIERNVGRTRVKAACQTLRRNRKGRELPRHIETTTQCGQVLLLFGVLLRNALAHRVDQLPAEEPDQQFQYRVALPTELRIRHGIDLDVPRHGQHVDKPVAQRGAVRSGFASAFNLWQDFKLAVACSDHAHHAACAKLPSAVFQHTFASAPGEGRCPCNCGKLIRLGLRKFVFARTIPDVFPFKDGTLGHCPVSPA